MATIIVPDVGRPPLALLVDRDADTRHTYAEFLRQFSCDIIEAADGRQALAYALTRHPDVIVLETRLPGLSGLDLCRLLRRDAETADIPVLFVTADALEPDIRRAQAAGANAVLVKPCLPEQLAAAVLDALSHSYALRQHVGRLQEKVVEQLRQSSDLIGQAREIRSRKSLTRSHDRRETTQPPNAAPELRCPTCDQRLKYVKSFVGGVNVRHPEQWDYFECRTGCGAFQYRQRTRKLRRVS